MIHIIDKPWLETHLNDPQTRIIDPRPRIKYLQGHIPKAVNLPLSEIFDKDTLRLHSESKLADGFARLGVDIASRVVLYDSYDGQSAAVLAWLLEYLGHPEVSVLSEYFERWVKHGGKVLYRPVTNEPGSFQWKPGTSARADISGILDRDQEKLLDLRGREEFLGKLSSGPQSGHIPGAINLPWTDLIGRDDRFLRSSDELEDVFLKTGLKASDRIITYCSNGPRAALGYIALQLAGFENVKVYDGSIHQWAGEKGLPVEAGRDDGLGSKSEVSQASPCIVDSIPGVTRAE